MCSSRVIVCRLWGEAFGRVCKVTEEILDDVNISDFIAGNPSIDILITTDTDDPVYLTVFNTSGKPNN